MKDDALKNDMENKHLKSNKEIKKRELVENTNIVQTNTELDIPSYLDDFLQYSKKTIFITGNNNIKKNNDQKKIIIKKKKILNNIKNINNEKDENVKKNTNEIEPKTNNKNILKKISKSYIKINSIKQNQTKDKSKIKIKIAENKIKSETEKENIQKENEIKTNKRKINLNKKLDNCEYEENLDIYNKYYFLFRQCFIHKIKNEMKILYILSKIKKQMTESANKIINTYKGYNFQNKLKKNYIISKILNIRNQKAEKINFYLKNFVVRLRVKKLLQKADNSYIIYSSINVENNDILYFKYKHKNGKEENFYFEYSPQLKCFIFFINKNNNKYLKIIEGNFYGSNNNKLIDKSFDINTKGENIINLPNIFKKADMINDKNDRIINRYIKLHKPSKRIMIDDYELIKKQSKDDYNLIKNSNSKSQKLGKIGKITRSSSYLRIKGECKTKSILKPSRSYMNLKSCDKKIQFGKAKIKKYKNIKE